ncbi:vWA domain-containing protein [Embleya hyalina]|uniref:VWFA domain-containing protein n=1 Tax=Embleya hyalina TaxID=516124 RepID=A0A401YVY5_9ACTN|nr:vWA domain-containing protein [Embleya hyalina]GCD98788.1 hypothetical protein EHYA_06499 [Embleya hyalina]
MSRIAPNPHRPRARARLVVPVLLLILALCASASPAHGVGRADGEPPADATARLLDELGADAQPADFYMVLDVSTSMRENGGYDEAKTALRTLLTAMQPRDRISVIRFGATTTVFRPLDAAPRGEAAVSAFLAGLPKPNDVESDFGAAMVSVSGIVAAAHPSADGYRPPTVIVVLTDADLYAPNNPRFADESAPGWEALRLEYAKAVAEHGPISAYAMPLGDNGRGVNLIAKVLPRAETLSGSVAEQAARVRALEQDARVRKGAAVVRADRDATVRARFAPAPAHPRGARPTEADCAGVEPPVDPIDLSTRGTLCLTLVSTAHRIRLTVADLHTGDPAIDRALPRDPITLAPGVPRHFPIEVRAHERTRSDLFARSRSYAASTTVRGTVTATRAGEFADLLRVEGPYADAGLRDGRLAYTGRVRGSVMWSVWALLVAAMALVAAGGTAAWRWFPAGVYIELSMEEKRSEFPESTAHPALGMRHRWTHEHDPAAGAITSFLARGRRPRSGRGVTLTARHERDGRIHTSRRRLSVDDATMLYGVRARVLRRPPTPRPGGADPASTTAEPAPIDAPAQNGRYSGITRPDPGEQHTPVAPAGLIPPTPTPRPPR